MLFRSDAAVSDPGSGSDCDDVESAVSACDHNGPIKPRSPGSGARAVAVASRLVVGGVGADVSVDPVSSSSAAGSSVALALKGGDSSSWGSASSDCCTLSPTGLPAQLMSQLQVSAPAIARSAVLLFFMPFANSVNGAGSAACPSNRYASTVGLALTLAQDWPPWGLPACPFLDLKAMIPLPIIIDCDPGVDDAIALLLALRSPELAVQAITVVAGNVPLALTQRNARQICELLGRRDIPIYAGCPRPLVRSLVTAEDIHGKTGLEGATLPDPALPLASGHAVSYLVETQIGRASCRERG